MPFQATTRLAADRKKQLGSFQKALKIRFKDVRHLEQALVHRSAVNEGSSHSASNERLEFLGDSVLGLVVAAALYERLPGRPEGDLARIKSAVVSEECLSSIAFDRGIDKLMVMGKGEELSGGRGKKAIMADALEALIGALYLDSGFPSARTFVLNALAPEIENVIARRNHKDYKTIIQEFVQKRSKTIPRYEIVRQEGPDHGRTFWVRLSMLGRSWDEVDGKTKKEAEQKAANIAYDAILAEGGELAAFLLSCEK